MPTDSAYDSFDLPNVDLWEFMFDSPRDGQFPEDKVIYRAVDNSRHYTWADVRSTAAAFGSALVERWQWQKGDVMCVFSPNDVDYGPCIYGTLWAGGIIAPANPGYNAKDLAFMLKNAGAKAIVTQKPLLKVALEAAKLAGIKESSIILIGDDGAGNTDATHFKNLLKQTKRSRPYKLDSDNDLAFLAYSSGTTGLPKGVMLSHRNIIADVLGIKSIVGENYNWRNDKILAILPFFHIYGWSYPILA
ncbi:hypothetical protein LTR78_004862 [Recurvomyces mirabilis]|uniref:AMP-dependent synthetase/ligase domain-containing protein n=1 Tax=Recurvomyces mirabilis TaxID=574656 RepID=A0AAE0WP91_9PEZI|nr:hypothetical protein LTR78_004862 [Recurvomyces mirabilis]KAK5158033.1 hypothetical protein LTS14_003956 [Recurvomyces mirabilis]